MKPVILIAKGGSVFYTRAAAKNASVVGEQGETEGIIRHLAARDDIRLVYYGAYRGERLCEVFEPDLDDVNEMMSDSFEKQRHADMINDLQDYLGDDQVIGFINVAGYAPTFSHVDNPRGAAVQAAAVRYTAPMHNALNVLRIPRIVINNDPRTYPRDQEMSYGWDYSRPAALLDQRNGMTVGVVGGKKYVKHSVHGYCESWGHVPELSNSLDIAATAIAHAHLDDGIRSGDPSAWDIVLGGGLPEGFRVIGRGWDHYHAYDPVLMPGPVRSTEVGPILAQAMCCPVVSHSPGFYTGKPYVCIANGCIPLLFGDGRHTHTYDPRGDLVPLTHHTRIRVKGDLKRISETFFSDREWYWETLKQFRQIFVPRWDKLDQLVDDLVAGVDWQTDRGWRERYGGYYPV